MRNEKRGKKSRRKAGRKREREVPSKSKMKKGTGEKQGDEVREPYFRRACHSSPGTYLHRCPLTRS